MPTGALRGRAARWTGRHLSQPRGWLAPGQLCSLRGAGGRALRGGSDLSPTLPRPFLTQAASTRGPGLEPGLAWAASSQRGCRLFAPSCSWLLARFSMCPHTQPLCAPSPKADESPSGSPKAGSYGLNFVPSTRYVEALTPKTPQCELIRRQGLYRGSEANVRTGPAPSVTGVLLYEGRLDTDTFTGRPVPALLRQGTPRKQAASKPLTSCPLSTSGANWFPGRTATSVLPDYLSTASCPGRTSAPRATCSGHRC